MRKKSSPHRDALAIAVATGVGVTTVLKYYRGETIREGNLRTIERACVELGLPLKEDSEGSAA